jgi:hypothetical protein
MARTLTETEIAAAARMLRTAKPRALSGMVEMHFGPVDSASVDAVRARIAEIIPAPAPAAAVAAPAPAPVVAAPASAPARRAYRCVDCGTMVSASTRWVCECM